MSEASEHPPIQAALIRAGRGLGVALVAAGVVVGLWHFAVMYYAIPVYLMPKPGAVWQAMIDKRAVLGTATGITVGSAALGLAVSTLFATMIAVSFIINRYVAQAAMPLVIALRSAPVVAVAPLIMLFVGRGIATSVIVVVIVSFFPILVNLMRGLQAPDANSIELLHVYGATRWQQIRLVRAPFSVPYLFTGLRIAGANAILGAMLSEWITGSRGLGLLILESGDLREVEMLWGAVVVAIFVALAVFWITSAAERAFLHWRG